MKLPSNIERPDVPLTDNTIRHYLKYWSKLLMPKGWVVMVRKLPKDWEICLQEQEASYGLPDPVRVTAKLNLHQYQQYWNVGKREALQDFWVSAVQQRNQYYWNWITQDSPGDVLPTANDISAWLGVNGKHRYKDFVQAELDYLNEQSRRFLVEAYPLGSRQPLPDGLHEEAKRLSLSSRIRAYIWMFKNGRGLL